MANDTLNIRFILNNRKPRMVPNNYQISYSCQDCGVYNVPLINENKNNFTLRNFKIGNYNYSIEFKISLKGNHYFECLRTNFESKSRAPEKVPKTFLFSESDRPLVLYWNSLARIYHNGKGFHYRIHKIDISNNSYTENCTK